MCIAPDTWHDACTTCYSTRILDILDQRTKVPNTEYYILRFRSIWYSYLSAAERYVDLILTLGLDITPLLVYFYLSKNSWRTWSKKKTTKRLSSIANRYSFSENSCTCILALLIIIFLFFLWENFKLNYI